MAVPSAPPIVAQTRPPIRGGCPTHQDVEARTVYAIHGHELHDVEGMAFTGSVELVRSRDHDQAADACVAAIEADTDYLRRHPDPFVRQIGEQIVAQARAYWIADSLEDGRVAAAHTETRGIAGWVERTTAGRGEA